MLKNIIRKRVDLAIVPLFILAEIILSIYVQIGEKYNNVVAYCSVALAFLFVIYYFKKDYLWLFTACAMIFTLCADVFLVLIEPRKQLLAMFIFNFAQIAYALRLFNSQTTKKAKIIHLIIRIFTCIVSVIATIIVLNDNLNLLSVVSIVYYSNLIINIVYAFIVRDYIFAIGLVFFAFCDAFIGLDVLSEGVLNITNQSLLYNILHPGFDPVWACYVPSQTLIALSIFQHKHKFTKL